MLCCLTPLLHAQTALSGKVVSAGTNEPLVGVNIRVDNSLTGCTTNGRGEFTIDNLPGRQHTLRFSYIGFTPGKYTTDGQETDILVKLEESYSNLSQVVVTGTGTHRRMTDSPVPVSVITAKEIGGANVSTLEEALVKLTPNISSYTNGMHRDTERRSIRPVRKRCHRRRYQHHHGRCPEHRKRIQLHPLLRRGTPDGKRQCRCQCGQVLLLHFLPAPSGRKLAEQQHRRERLRNRTSYFRRFLLQHRKPAFRVQCHR